MRALFICLLLATSAAAEPLGTRIARRAARFVGLDSVRRISTATTDDCTGFVELMYRGEGVLLDGSVVEVHRRAHAAGALHRASPRRGDLIFFRNTYDRDRNGVLDDGLTHVGIVDSVRKDGVVTFIHRVRKGIARFAMDPNRPDLHRDARGRVHNDFLRRRSSKGPAALAGELWVDYASASELARSVPMARGPVPLSRRSGARASPLR